MQTVEKEAKHKLKARFLEDGGELNYNPHLTNLKK